MGIADPHSQPSVICVEDGHVIIDGPGPIAITLTAEAAIETSDRLLEAGVQAHGENVSKATFKP